MCLMGSPPPSSGLSPRVRGNLLLLVLSTSLCRSIPACAGEPVIPGMMNVPSPVYPRVCGGTEWVHATSASVQGLSPRVRGNQLATSGHILVSGSIPACAGEPHLNMKRDIYDRGLSPRVRGNQPFQVDTLNRRGSIPACAGEPQCHATRSLCKRVYPRVCGGTPIT